MDGWMDGWMDGYFFDGLLVMHSFQVITWIFGTNAHLLADFKLHFAF
jgi:hypothetical protein